MRLEYKEHTIKTESVERDWSEDAYIVYIDGREVDTCEGEGEENVVEYAQEWIDDNLS